MGNYDSWKLASPPEYEARDTCPSCGEQEGFEGDQCKCGWDADDQEQDWDAKIDEARGK